MECLIAIGSSILGKIAEYTVEPVGRQLGYLFYYKSNIDNLRNKVGELAERVTRLTEQVEEAEKKGEEIEAAVQEWLDESKKLSDETRHFLETEGQITMQRCSSGSMVLRYKSSKKAKKMKDAVVNEIQDGREFSEVSYYPNLPPSVENKDFDAFGTRRSVEIEIMEALRDSRVSSIGVYGMPGVGKTMLAKEIAKKTTDEGLFLKVAMVVLSQTPDVRKIQQEIAEQLGLRLDEESPPMRAGRLRHGLSKQHKTLIVLDDIWKELDLWEAGIRFENDQKGCKLFFTSRSLDVLRDFMGVDSNFTIGALSPSEAMSLFKKMVGVRDEQAGFERLAVEVVEECGGLPIAIVTVAKALKNQGLFVWRDALRQLRNSSPTNIEGMSEKVYSSVKLSYDFLRSEEAKSLLLLCSLHEEDERIDSESLMRYGVGWGLFQDVDTLDEARDRVNSLLDKLKARCLLLDGSHAHEPNIVRVMMHDVIRDVGISIASEERRMINFKTAFKLEEWSSKRKLKDSTAIFLCARNVDNHIGKLECPELELFLRRGSTFVLPDDFFEETKKVRALNLSRGNLESPPSSFFVLQNLVTLCLSWCKLGDVTFIGELKHLEILDLTWSSVAKLPRQIKKLTRLRLLDLRYCRDLKVIEADVISNLIRLEELYMYDGFTQWDGTNTSLSEIKNLSRLTILSLTIPVASVLPKDLFPEKLEKFDISIGSVNCFHEIQTGINSPNSFCAKLMKSNQVAEHELEILMQKSEEFHLEVFEDLNIISVNELEREGFPRLKKFLLRDSGGMKYIVNSEGHNRPRSVFPNLERLQLRNLKMLENICYGKLAGESFGKLSVLAVESCNRLKNVVQFSIAKRLEDIRVSGCSRIKEIVFQSEYENEDQLIPKVEFPRLRTLELAFLPTLVQFSWSHLETGTPVSSMLNCPLFSEKVVFPSLIDLDLAHLNIKKLWPDQLLANSYSIQNCPNLSKLNIYDCPKLSTILDTNSTKKDEQEGMSSVAAQPLFLEKRCGTLLPSFISFNNLKTLDVASCPRVINLLTSSTARGLVHLSTMEIATCEQLTEIITMSEDDETEGEIVFTKLRRLILYDLPNLKRFYSGNTNITFPELEELVLCGCPELQSFSHGSVSSSKLTSIITQTYMKEFYGYAHEEFVWEGDINTTVLKHWENDPITYIRHLFMETESI